MWMLYSALYTAARPTVWTSSGWFPKTNKSSAFCKKPEQNEGSWSWEESGSRYLDRRRRRRASRTGSVSSWQQLRSDSSLLNLMMLLRYAGQRWWRMECITVTILNWIRAFTGNLRRRCSAGWMWSSLRTSRAATFCTHCIEVPESGRRKPEQQRVAAV